jgi:hypothetical protein
MLDPKFPERLTSIGYQRTLEFIQHMFEGYAQAGLTKRSDKKVAISGLLQRMQDVIGSKCVHGTFHCFLSRLLLWQVSDTITNNEAACSGDTKHPLPSWSWMSHDHIQFFTEERLKVPVDANRFDTDGQLHVQIFQLHDSGIEEEEQGERHVLLRHDTQEVGQFWFDTHEKTQIRDCVVVGKSPRDMWFILLVMDIGEKRYKRFGVGNIKPRDFYISKTHFSGVLV